MTPTLVSPPAFPFVPAPDVEALLRLDTTEDATVINALAAAAMSYLDGWSGVLGRCVVPQTWRVTAAGFEDMTLPFPDLRSVVVTYRDAANAVQTLDAAAYRTGEGPDGAWIAFDTGVSLPATYSRDDAVTIDGTYGFAEVPAALRTAGTMLAGYWAENRVGGGNIPPMVAALIAPFRRVRA